MKKLTWIVIVILIVIGLIAVRIKRVHQKNNAPLVRISAPAVDVASISHGEVLQTHHVLGVVIGGDEAKVAPRIMAQVMEMKVREGTHVVKGQVLALLDRRELDDAVAQSLAGVQSAQENLVASRTAYDARRDATRRDEKLFNARAISQEQWDNSRAAEKGAAAKLEAAKAGVVVAQKRLDQTKTRLDYAVVKSPFSGEVAARLADPGDLAIPGRPLYTIIRYHNVRVRAKVPMEDFPLISRGSDVKITLGSDVIHTRVSRLFPAMDRANLASFECDLADPPASFVSRATVGVDITLARATGFIIPSDAILDGEKGSILFIVKDARVHPVKVKVLSRSETSAVVDGDLNEGESVVVARPSRLMMLADGMSVKPVRSE